jgi:hypothetical protein
MIFYASLAIAGGLLVIVGMACAIVDRVDPIPRDWFYTSYQDLSDDSWGDFFGDDWSD